MSINNVHGPGSGIHGAGQHERPEATPSKPAGEASAKVSSITGSDQVRLTDESQRLRQLENSMGAEPTFDTKRVEALREAIASGRYQVDAERVAKGLMDLESQLFKE